MSPYATIAPAWLSLDSPEGDIVISSRCRFARNLRGLRFPHAALEHELLAAREKVLCAETESGLQLERFDRSTHEGYTLEVRDHLVAARLITPEFPTDALGRVALIDPERSVSLMINEEDHIRLQALTAGWSILNAMTIAAHVLSELEPRLEFAKAAKWGCLAACPLNAGRGRRLSAMFHLIGLAHTKRLSDVLKALGAREIEIRGVYGEASRAVGAFFQVSVVRESNSAFAGACEYLIREERSARRDVPRGDLLAKVQQAVEFAASSEEVTLIDALRVLAWVRWAAVAPLKHLSISHREVDLWLSMLEVRAINDGVDSSKRRARFLRRRLTDGGG